ncbi:helix-turn-helix domain-containing protein [Myroides odoratimimus]|uniref:AraC family transcriptional regulator n=1 Tax=Myroides odoratimimus TaxID=76832 RepID=UPI0020983A50|nr:helix-turn-helix domain-containing protein [Myroides odoratimimus]MCO7724275.1 helix-turn-helix domain-containing protein [Myroides odoratimimus]
MESVLIDLKERITLSFGVDYGICTKENQFDYPVATPYLSFFFVEAGRALISVDFKEYILSKGNFIIVGEDNIVTFREMSEDYRMHCFLIQRDFASEIAYVLPNELFSYLHYFPVQYFSEENIRIYNHWHSVSLYMIEHTSIHTKRMLCNQFQILFLNLSEQVNYDELIIEKHYSRQEELCWKFWDLITHHAKQHRDVAFYADTLCITPYYLSQITQQFLNYSPKELINRQVVLEIKDYLRNTDLNISQIAEQLNFQDPSYMGRFFKRETGVNPLQFRR